MLQPQGPLLSDRAVPEPNRARQQADEPTPPVTSPGGSFAPLIFRIASWPMETVEALRSAAFTAEVEEALARQEEIRVLSVRLSDLLHKDVPRLDREERRIALRVRRTLHRSTDPVSRQDLEALAGFPNLGEATRTLLLADDSERLALRCRFEKLRSAYTNALDREWKALVQIAGESSFRKALAVASASTSDAWEQALRDGGHVESWRLRATLLNYILRAAGRATPNSLWAGIAMEVPGQDGETIHVRTATAKVFAKPDVNAFFDLFSAASSERHYRHAVYLRWNPTLTEIAPGEYVYAHCCRGDWVFARASEDGDLSRLRQSICESGPLSFDRLRAQSGLPEEVLHRFYVTGLLQPECDRDGIYEDAAAALEALVACLLPAEQARWRDAISGLQDICASVQREYNELDAEGLRRYLGQARRIVNALRSRYDANPLPEDRSVLVFDLMAPFEISVPPAVRDQITQSLERYWTFDRGGMGELLAEGARRSMAASQGADAVLAVAGVAIERADGPAARETITGAAVRGSWEEMAEGIGPADLADRCFNLLQRWTEELEPVAGESVHRVGLPVKALVQPMGPGAALVVPGLTSDGMAARIGSVAPDWGAFYGRFHHLFVANGRAEFRNWFEHSKAWVENQGFVLADVVVRGMHERNAALRPRLGSQILDPLAASIEGMTVEFDPDSGVSLRHRSGRPVFPVLHSAVETLAADPWSRWFADFGRQAGRTSLLSPQPPLARELTAWKHSPRLILDERTVIAPERWWCPAETSESLRNCTGFDRFVAWRAWLRRTRVPEKTYAQYGAAGTETLLLADSVLSIEVLGRALAQTDAPLRLQEMFFGEEGLWLRDGQGRKYMAEMAVAWTGSQEFWTV